jgi:sulfate permease, SulP family
LGTLARRTFPGLVTLAHYERSWLRGDLVAGVTVAAFLVPQVMAYAGLAGMPPVNGLWAALAALILYAIFGSSRQLSVGPESTTAILTAATLAPLGLSGSAQYEAAAGALAAMVGLLCLAAWLLRLGFLADLVSKPVLVGYLAGVAVIMIAGQLGKLTGTAVAGDNFVQEVRTFFAGIDQISWVTLALGVGVLVILTTFAVLLPRAPGPLIAVALATVVVWAFGLTSHGVAVVGSIPSGLPGVAVPTPAGLDVRSLVLPAIGVTVVAFTDTILTARAFASRSSSQVDNNQELLALGTVNLGSAFVRGFPVSSSASRTVIGATARSRTQLNGLVSAALVILTLLVLGPILAWFPLAALGALVVFAAVRLIDVAEFRRIYRFRRREFAIALTATVGVLAFDILYGVLIAIGLSVVELLVRVARPHDAVLGRVPGLAGMHDRDDYPESELIPGLIVYRYDSPLFFANANDFLQKALAVIDREEIDHGPVRWFILNVEANVEVDITGVDALEELRATCERRGIVLALARVKQDLLRPLERYGLTAKIGADHLYPTLPVAVAAYQEWARCNPAESEFD